MDEQKNFDGILRSIVTLHVLPCRVGTVHFESEFAY